MPGLKKCAEIAADPDLRRRLGDYLLFLLERIDSTWKAHVLAILFREFLNGRFDFETLQRLSFGIDQCYLYGLLSLDCFDATWVAPSLYTTGFVQLEFVTDAEIDPGEYSGPSYDTHRCQA